MGAKSGVMLMPASPPFTPALNRGLIPNLVSRAKFELCTREPVLGFSCPPFPSLPVSLSSNDLMNHPPILRPQPPARARWPLTPPPFPISCRGTSDPISTAQPWQSCPPVIRQNCKHKWFKELVSRISQHTQLAPPGNQTVRGWGPQSFGVVGPSTSTIPFVAFVVLHGRRLTRGAQ